MDYGLETCNTNLGEGKTSGTDEVIVGAAMEDISGKTVEKTIIE